MTRVPSLCAVILAAGESSRMGTDKALLPWPPNSAAKGDTFLSEAIEALAAVSDMVIVVAGKNEPHITPIADANGALLVINPEPERGQFSSLQCGLQEILNHGRDAAMFTLVDRPPVSASTLEKLKMEFGAALSLGKWAVVPEFGGKHGHPILVGREMIEAFLKAPPTSTAREIQHQNQARIAYVVVDDPLVVANVDTPQDYASLISQPAQDGG
jgi:molybdenum cofactor cytidylyltransferase